MVGGHSLVGAFYQFLLCMYSMLLFFPYSSVGVPGVNLTSEEGRDGEEKNSLILTANEQSLMMSDDIIQCLFSAMENWELMREKGSTLNLAVS